jgi:WD40 repeat protein
VKPKFKSKRSKWPIFRNFHSKPKLAVLIEALGYTPSKTTQFGDIVQDAKRFILYNGSIIEKAPLQVYASALVFSPQTSLIRQQFLGQHPMWIDNWPSIEENWSPSLQTLEGHSGSATAVVFSPDGQLLASASHDWRVRLWNAKTGALLRTLKGHSDWVTAVAFSPDGQLLASASGDKTVRLWDAKAVVLQRTLEVGSISSLSFSIDGSRLETNKGPIKLGITPPDPSPSILWSQSLYSLNDDKSWVMWNGHNILWLPPEYRPTCEKVQDNILAMGHASGRVTIAQFNPDTIYLAKEVWVI